MTKKIVVALGLFTALSTTGCTLYFGDADDDDGWADDGGGWYCDNDNQCAAGCYCSNQGVCEEAGFCSSDADCPSGFECDEARNSCDPDGGSNGCSTDEDCGFGAYCDAATGTCIPTWTCDPGNPSSCGTGYICTPEGTCVPIGCDGDDANCAAGCYCDDTTNNCVESCYCTSDADATAQGWGFCDETRTTCMPGDDPTVPVCGNGILEDGEVCDDGNTDDADGCTTTCQLTACDDLDTYAECSARMDCTAIINGQNCTNPDGSACTPGMGSSCTCENYVFNRCEDAAP